MLSPAVLRDLQVRAERDIPERFRFARILSVLALSEEIGELVGEVGESERPPDALARITSEAGDVLLSCIEIANAYGLTLEAVGIGRHDSDERALMLGICRAGGSVSRCCLEIEEFEHDHTAPLGTALNAVVGALEEFTHLVGIDLQAAFETTFTKIVTLIQDGTWEARYGDRLVAKRLHFDRST